MKNLLVITILLALSSCAVKNQFQATNLFFELEKTACMGQCPVYSMKIDSKGNVIFNGKENVKNLNGNFYAKLTADQLQELNKLIQKSDFFNLKDSYRSFKMDLPTKFVSVTKDGTVKKVKAYDDYPEDLDALIKYADAFRKELKWMAMK